MDIYDFNLETKEISDAGIFEGYASTFGNVDQGLEVVEAGAFIKGIIKAKKEGRLIPMLWQHSQSDPIGVWKDMSEDSKGLYVKGQIVLEAAKGKEAYALIKAKALGGLSIGYSLYPGSTETDPKRPGVTRLKEIDLREVSLVTMPMNTEARITTVKNFLTGKSPDLLKKWSKDDLPTVPEFERFLSDSGRFSKALATMLASGNAPFLRGDPEQVPDEATALLSELLKRYTH